MGFNMNRAEFEAELGRDGYDCREVEIPPTSIGRLMRMRLMLG